MIETARRLAVPLALLAAGPLAAQDVPRAWDAALTRCILPFEAMEWPDTEDIGRAESLPDWVSALPGAEVWALGDGIYLSLIDGGTIGHSTCTIHAPQADGRIVAAFEEWSAAQISAGRYRPEVADQPAPMTSTIWREPRMQVSLRLDDLNGSLRIRVAEIDAEA